MLRKTDVGFNTIEDEEEEKRVSRADRFHLGTERTIRDWRCGNDGITARERQS